MKKTIIGGTATVNFPDLGWYDVPARVDTGAATSSIHCSGVRLIEREGKVLLRFYLDAKKGADRKPILVSEFRERVVKNSFGQSERRYFIKTVVEVGGRAVRTQISLADRYRMSYPVLLGRRFLKGKFVVDVSL